MWEQNNLWHNFLLRAPDIPRSLSSSSSSIVPLFSPCCYFSSSSSRPNQIGPDVSLPPRKKVLSQNCEMGTSCFEIFFFSVKIFAIRSSLGLAAMKWLRDFESSTTYLSKHFRIQIGRIKKMQRPIFSWWVQDIVWKEKIPVHPCLFIPAPRWPKRVEDDSAFLSPFPFFGLSAWPIRYMYLRSLLFLVVVCILYEFRNEPLLWLSLGKNQGSIIVGRRGKYVLLHCSETKLRRRHWDVCEERRLTISRIKRQFSPTFRSSI